ncbi:MAG: AraC family transcriptional regulator [Verrucomicrobiia bacterium]
MDKYVGHLTLYERRLKPGVEWNVQLPGWVFVRVNHGSGSLLLPESSRLLAEAEVICAGHSCRCVIRASVLGDLQLDYFYVVPELLTGIVSLLESHQLQQMSQTSRVDVFPDRHPLAEQFTTLTRQARADDYLAARCAMVYLSVSHLRGATAASPAPAHPAPSAADRIEALVRRIPAAEFQSVSASKLARECGCSVRHFSRLFKAQFGVTLLPKQIDLRLDRARLLLLETDAKIVNISMDCGFQHPGLFTAMFKKHFGLTPSAWRKRRRRAVNFIG